MASRQIPISLAQSARLAVRTRIPWVMQIYSVRQINIIIGTNKATRRDVDSDNWIVFNADEQDLGEVYKDVE